MMKSIKVREGKGFEVQFYAANGDAGMVMQCDTVEELAQYLARCCWGNNLANWEHRNLPTIWKDGKKWCFHEYTPV